MTQTVAIGLSSNVMMVVDVYPVHGNVMETTIVQIAQMNATVVSV